MRSEVMFFVADVEASSRWYQELLGARGAHGGDEYEQLVDERGELLLQLHHLDGDEHGAVAAEASTSPGAGVLLYVRVDDVHEVHRRAVGMGAGVESEPTYIDAARHTEFVVRDPDGFRVAVCTAGPGTA